ncbi:MAG: PAS domain S-box protein [Chloroflexi bacterium]|jgi:PAS domain S-box-containing protein|nr:PAS domain S-box protein [Chloroflexota bacterium]
MSYSSVHDDYYKVDTTVLIVEDDADLNHLIGRYLRRAGFENTSALTGSEAIDQFQPNGNTILLLDYMLPDMTGKQVVETLTKTYGQVPFIMVTGQGDERVAVEMMKLGAMDYLIKDTGFIDMVPEVVDRAIRQLDTERKLNWTETRLHESEERYRDLFENANDLIQSVDKDGRFVYVNRAWHRILGYEWGELEHLRFTDILVPDQRRHCTAIFEQLARGKEFVNIKTTFLTKDGCKVFVEGSIGARIIDGELVAARGIFRDITERKLAEAEIRKREQEYSSLVELSPDGIVLVKDGVIIFVNQRATELFGLAGGDLVGKNIGRLMTIALTDNMSELSDSERQSLIENPGQFSSDIQQSSMCQLPISNGLGEHLWIEVNSNPIDYRGEMVRLCFVRDITERKRIEQMKTDFVSLVSHQLRTPVGVIRGYVDNMLSGLAGELTDKQKQYLGEMQLISAKNYNLISDLLNVSRIERGVVSVEIEPVNLMEIVGHATREYSEPMESKGLALNVEFSEENIVVLADEDKMVEALCNIINNALKFTENGSVDIRAERNGSCAVVTVSDTGKGMSPDTIAKLFSRNQIFGGSPTPDGGSGLGLYIAKEFMELQNGNISVTSVEGEGSRFVFKVPLAK